MAALIRLPRARWRTPPTSGFGLDPGHWLVEKGIELYVPLCDRSSFFYRRAPVSPLTDSIARAPSPGSTWAVGTVNSTYTHLELLGSPLPFPFTLLAWGKAPATGTDARIAVSVSRNTTTNPGYHALRWTGSSSSPSYRIAAASYNGTNTYQSSFDAAYTDSWILGLALFRSDTYRLAGQNGVLASSSNTSTVSRGTVSQNVDIGARYASSAFGLYFDGSLFNVLALSYEMDAAGFERLYQEQKENPWGLLRPRASRVIFLPSSSGGSITLVVADAGHGHLADNIALTQANILTLQDALHVHAAESIGLTQAHILSLAESLHAHAADGDLTLTQAFLLAPADAAHAHAAAAVTLSTGLSLSPADAVQSHAADSVALTQAHLLSVAESLHSHAAEAISLGAGYALVVADTAHAHAAESPTVSVAFALALQDALHAQAADAVSLASQVTLIVSDTLHAHLAGSASEVTLPTGERIFLVAAEDRLFLVAAEDRLFLVVAEDRNFGV